jgi:[NiFe] hydrogenase diaphorase moiety large subunit
MSASHEADVRTICAEHHRDPGRLLDILRTVQARFACVDDAAMDVIAAELGIPRVEVASTVTFYSFLSVEPRGRVPIRLCNDVIDRQAGADDVARALEEELGIAFGETTPDGRFSLEWTPCIGMSDQAPAALVGDIVIAGLRPGVARVGVQKLREHGDPARLVRRLGDGHNADDLIGAMVENNIRRSGPVVLADWRPGAGLEKALPISPNEVIRTMKTARLRGRGGAGFPTGMKWDFCRSAEGEPKYVLCNADEGEPGTFKDRVILTERPQLMFEGMAIAGYAIGSSEGIVYLRAEYAYLRRYLEHVLAQMRTQGLLGRGILGHAGVDFDITIRMGAGAYVCGEETALISSLEGTRGDPKTRPPFPAQKGYRGKPSIVNNVETFCCAARIMEMGAAWFSGMGSAGSPGTKLLSIAGDCKRPGVYEWPFGVSLREVLASAGATDAVAVQVGGASGRMVGPKDFDRKICYDDLATGGAIMVFGPGRDVVAVAAEFMRFFVHESCGYCTPCRVGNVLMLEKLDRILDGRGEPADLDELASLAETVRLTSRCGLGQTSPMPVLSTLENFRDAYQAKVSEAAGGVQRGFDIHAALTDAVRITGRQSVHFAQNGSHS